ncbi:MAG: hypothetical protein ACP5JO_08715 [Candidatus Ratteibacteria bacterium]
MDIEKKNPLNPAPLVYLNKNEIHRAVLRITNTGTDTIFTGAIYLTKPGESEQLLVEKTFTNGPFEEAVISETFIANIEGEYRIKGEIKDITPQDIKSPEQPKNMDIQDKIANSCNISHS